MSNTVLSDATYQNIKEFLRTGTLPNLSSSSKYRFKKRFENYSLHNNKVYSVDGRLVIPESIINRLLQRIYNNPKYGIPNRDNLYNIVKGKFAHIPRTRVQNFLKTQETYQLHLHRNMNKVNRPIIPKYISERWEIDLVDLSKLGIANRQRKWLLVCVDLFSKYAFVKAITNKRPNTVRIALESILNSIDKIPEIIQCDNGPEFNTITKNFPNIKVIQTEPYNPKSNAQVERLNGTIKRMLFRMMTQKGDRNYINELQNIVKAYNNQVHKTTKYKPRQVWNNQVDNEVVYNNIKSFANSMVRNNNKYSTLEIGDSVRISIKTTKEYKKKPKQFTKSYVAQWSTEVFRIEGIRENPTNPDSPIYIIEDKQYFRQDLQKIDPDNTVPVDRINFEYIDREVQNENEPIALRRNRRGNINAPNRLNL